MIVYSAFCISSKGQGFDMWLYIFNEIMKFISFNKNKIYKTERNVSWPHLPAFVANLKKQ